MDATEEDGGIEIDLEVPPCEPGAGETPHCPTCSRLPHGELVRLARNVRRLVKAFETVVDRIPADVTRRLDEVEGLPVATRRLEKRIDFEARLGDVPGLSRGRKQVLRRLFAATADQIDNVSDWLNSEIAALDGPRQEEPVRVSASEWLHRARNKL